MPGMMSMGRALVGTFEKFDKAMKSVGKSKPFDGKLVPVLKDYVTFAVQLDETVDSLEKARKEADFSYDRVAEIKDFYRDVAKKAARTDPVIATAINRFMQKVTPEAAKNLPLRKAWQDFKKDYPSFAAARQAKMDFGPTLDAYAKI